MEARKLPPVLEELVEAETGAVQEQERRERQIRVAVAVAEAQAVPAQADQAL